MMLMKLNAKHLGILFIAYDKKTRRNAGFDFHGGLHARYATI